MPLVSETIIKHGVSHQQADNQAGKPGLKIIPCFTDTSQRAAVVPWRGSRVGVRELASPASVWGISI